MSKRDPILSEICSRRGLTKAIAGACGITSAAVSQWNRVPDDRISIVSSVTGVPADRLRGAANDEGPATPAPAAPAMPVPAQDAA